MTNPAYRRGAHKARRWLLQQMPGPREMPSYFIVGTKRGGTTSLNEYLVQHPEVRRPLVDKGCRYFDVNFDRGWDWFCSNFPLKYSFDRYERSTGRRPVIGESSPYYCFHPHAPARLAERFPDARILFCLRDPVARAWSHYQYERTRGYEWLDFDEALNLETERLSSRDPAEREFAHRHHSYLTRGMYADQIEHLRHHFDPEQILIVESEQLFNAPNDVMRKVHEHLHLTAWEGAYTRAHKQNTYEGLERSLRDRLKFAYAEPNARLRFLVGHLSWL